jgi:hypothetical protein
MECRRKILTIIFFIEVVILSYIYISTCRLNEFESDKNRNMEKRIYYNRKMENKTNKYEILENTGLVVRRATFSHKRQNGRLPRKKLETNYTSAVNMRKFKEKHIKYENITTKQTLHQIKQSFVIGDQEKKDNLKNNSNKTTKMRSTAKSAENVKNTLSIIKSTTDSWLIPNVNRKNIRSLPDRKMNAKFNETNSTNKCVFSFDSNSLLKEKSKLWDGQQSQSAYLFFIHLDTDSLFNLPDKKEVDDLLNWQYILKKIFLFSYPLTLISLPSPCLNLTKKKCTSIL